ncbi:MAG: hypothetical protein CSA86_00140 [Arcobacter sp.]|nr:MAG: hypothetical protein CSA86_00140 [Arcobacter sp.]
MRKVILSSILAVGLISGLNAYELDGDLGIKWTGFKTAKKVGVSGTFKDVKLDIQKADKLADFLKSAKVEIDTMKINSKLPMRDKNITSTIFSLASAKTVKGTISKVDEAKKELTLDVTMNGVTKQIPMTYTLSGGKIVAKGTLEILDFKLKSSFEAFAKKCRGFHAGKTFSDVDVEFTLPYK